VSSFTEQLHFLFITMKTSVSKISLLAGAFTVSALVTAAPVKAVSIFNFTTPVSTNTPSRTFIDDPTGFSVTFDNSNSVGKNPGTFNTDTQGMCVYSYIGATSIGKPSVCNYGRKVGSGITSFQLSFNRPALIQGFEIGQFASALTTNGKPVLRRGTIGFSLDNINFTSYSFKSAGFVAADFAADPGQTVYVQTSARFRRGADPDTSVIRVRSFSVQEVPGPLPALGLAAAFGWSRKLRKKIAA
jgi:hypothetical protein